MSTQDPFKSLLDPDEDLPEEFPLLALLARSLRRQAVEDREEDLAEGACLDQLFADDALARQQADRTEPPFREPKAAMATQREPMRLAAASAGSGLWRYKNGPWLLRLGLHSDSGYTVALTGPSSAVLEPESLKLSLEPGQWTRVPLSEHPKELRLLLPDGNLLFLRP